MLNFLAPDRLFGRFKILGVPIDLAAHDSCNLEILGVLNLTFFIIGSAIAPTVPPHPPTMPDQKIFQFFAFFMKLCSLANIANFGSGVAGSKFDRTSIVLLCFLYS